MGIVSAWFKGRKAERDAADYRVGFACAKHLLESGAETLERIEALADAGGIDPTEFDRGARDALREFEKARAS